MLEVEISANRPQLTMLDTARTPDLANPQTRVEVARSRVIPVEIIIAQEPRP